MKVVTKKYNVYSFDELCEESKEKAINDYIDFLVQVTDFESLNKNSNMYKAYKKANEMRTPWFLGSYVWEYCQKQIMKELKGSQYEYLENGSVFVE